MVSITQTQFRQKAISSLEKDSGGKVKLSGPQETILLAAYGVYSREVGILDKKKSEQIKELEVDMVKEQARTALALTWSSETAQKFGNFLVTPIHEWGRQLPAPQLGQERNPENFSKTPENDANVIEGQVVVENEVSDNRTEEEKFEGSLDRMPWYLWIPTTMLSRIFGGMTPLSFALLLMAVVAGAILYGSYARSIWKERFDAEVEASTQLRSEVEQRDQEIAELLVVRSENQQLRIDIEGIRDSLGQESRASSDLRQSLADLNDEFTAYKIDKEAAHSAEIAQFQKDSSEAFVLREQEQAKRITEFELEISNLENQKLTLKQRMSQLETDFKSSSDTEAQLQSDLDGAFARNRELDERLRESQRKVFELQDVNRALAAIPSAVNTYFWERREQLETKRACFRNFYVIHMAPYAGKLEAYVIPEDMQNARYDLQNDRQNLLDRCNRF